MTSRVFRSVSAGLATVSVLLATSALRAQQPYYGPPQQPYPPQYPQQPYAPPPPPPPPPAAADPDENKPGWDLDAETLGLRGSTLGVSGGDREARTYSLNVASMGVSNYAGSIFTYRATGLSLLGGGSGGLEGQLGGTLAVGLGFLIDGKQGPFARVGVRGYILGNDSFFHSNIQFPEASVGWHLGSRHGFLLEGGLTAGPMLDGRFNVGDEGRRRLGSSGAFGAYVDAFIGPLTGTAQWVRTSAVSDPGTVVDAIDGHLCLSTGRSKKETGLALCFDGRHTRGDVLFGSPIQTSAAATTYFGLTIGFGFAQSKPK